MAGIAIDSLTDRPIATNVPYTVLTKEQIGNIKQDCSPFFRVPKPIKFDDSRHYVDRYTYSTNAQIVRGMARSHPHCWVDYQKTRDLIPPNHTSRWGSSVKWGPITTGRRTYQHYSGEEPHRYTMIDMYRRPPTNMPGRVVMDFGRPGEGYYSQRNPHSTTWFGSKVPLNKTGIFENIHPKTEAEYQSLRAQKKQMILSKQWPEFSEYTDRYGLNTKLPPKLTTLERNKIHVAQSRLLETK